MRSIDVPQPKFPGAEISALDRLEALWQQAGLESLETRVIHIGINYSAHANAVKGRVPIS